MFRINICIVLVLLSQIISILSAAATNKSVIQSRIKGGTDANIINAPFVVSVRLRAEEKKVYGSGVECGGSLISNNVVLTAAHCLTDDLAGGEYRKPEDYLVVMGTSDTDYPDKHTLQFNVKNLAMTNNYIYDDIGLIFLDGSVPENHPTAKPVILNNGPLEDDMKCQTYGWGDMGNDKYPTTLKVVDLPLITVESCVFNTVYGGKVHRGMICAGKLEKGGVATCPGDSGGPLVCGGIQVGITIWSRRPCGLPRAPSVFTNVAEYKTWITKHVFLNDGTQPKFANAIV